MLLIEYRQQWEKSQYSHPVSAKARGTQAEQNSGNEASYPKQGLRIWYLVFDFWRNIHGYLQQTCNLFSLVLKMVLIFFIANVSPVFLSNYCRSFMISLTPYSLENPVEVSGDDYNKLVQMKEKGWSHCDSKEECLAKLHYLRSGFYQGKISIGDFNEREKKLVIGYWNRGG